MDADWDRGHGPLNGPFNAAGTALAIGYGGHVWHASPWLGAGVAAAGLVGHHIHGMRRKAPRFNLALRATTWLTAGSWCSWAIAHGAWAQTSLEALGGGSLLLGLAWAGELHAEHKAERAQQVTEAARAINGQAAEWQARIDRVCHIEGARVVGIEGWPTGGGFTLDVELPGGGATWKTLRGAADGLAADARLPEGCGVEVHRGVHRGAALVEVSTVNHLVNDVFYPEDYSPLSVNEPAPVGIRRDGTPYGHVMRQQSALIVGQRGSGKTNLLNVMLANQCRMVDSITWVIDLNGGGLAIKWLRLWHAMGRPGKPPIDWVADTPEKALKLARAAERIALARKVGYQDREIAADDDKLPVDREVPEIRIVNDEGATLFSTKARLSDETLKQVANTLVNVLEIARAAAVNETTTGLRGTQDVIAEAQVLKQSTLKVAMKVADDSELNYFFGWHNSNSAEDAPYPGCAIVQEDQTAWVEKIYRLRPSQMRDVIKATAQIRPELDELSRKAAGEDYERRWEDTDHIFGTGHAPAADNDKRQTSAAAPQAGVEDPTANWGKSPLTGSVADILADADQSSSRLRDAVAENSGHDETLEEQFRAVVEGGGGVWKAPEPPVELSKAGMPVDPRKEMVFEIVRAEGVKGLGPKEIQSKFQTRHPALGVPSRSAITDWLKDDARIEQPARGLYVVKEEYR